MGSYNPTPTSESAVAKGMK